jgi:uncharacterized protein (DUF3820 family)
MTDESIMPIGKYRGEKMANVPPEYLLWMYENTNIIYDELKQYIKDNLDIIKSEINYKNKSK